MLTRILTSAMIAGFLAGLLVSALQAVEVIPLILEAETYENAGESVGAEGLPPAAPPAHETDTPHDHAPARAPEAWAPEDWAPEEGGERILFTVLTNILTATGFALLLAAAFAVKGDIDWRHGVIWGLGGFAAFHLAPALGLPPELPGSVAAPLHERQIWWLGTVAATAVGLGLAALHSKTPFRLAGLALIVLPHIIGAPHVEGPGGPVPGELAAKFAVSALVTAGVFWVFLGGVTGFLFRFMADRAAPPSSPRRGKPGKGANHAKSSNPASNPAALTAALLAVPLIALSGVSGRAACEGDFPGCAIEGVSLDVVYTGEVWNNTRGGLKRGTAYIDNLDMVLEVDAEKAWGWKGATFLVYGLWNNGDPLSQKIVGDAQTLSNIEAPNAFTLFELWYEQNLFDDRLSFKGGLYDLNSEFDVIETGGLFISSFHGIGPDFSQAGENGPSIFPVTSLAARLRLAPAENIYVQAAVFDGVPGDPKHPERNALILRHRDGTLMTAEAGYQNPRGTKAALGYWRFSASFDDVLATNAAGDPLRRRGNDGLYALGEHWVYREGESGDQGLSVFARFGIADGDVNQFSHYIGGGAVYTGLLPERDEDQLGFAIAAARNGVPFKKAQKAAGNPLRDQEISFELTYRLEVMPFLALQPDIQYIMDPGAGANGDLDDALVVGLRFEVSPFNF